jgi:hypothetical protein
MINIILDLVLLCGVLFLAYLIIDTREINKSR